MIHAATAPSYWHVGTSAKIVWEDDERGRQNWNHATAGKWGPPGVGAGRGNDTSFLPELDGGQPDGVCGG